MKITLLLCFTILFSIKSYGGVEVVELSDYSDVTDLVIEKTKNYKMKSTQVVFDLDDTVIRTMDCPEVDKIENGFKRFEESVLKCGAQLTSPVVLELIENLKAHKYPVMAMTARRYMYGQLKGTLRQLQTDLTLSEGSGLQASVHFETAPKYSEDVVLIPYEQPLKKGGNSYKEMAYKEGVGFVAFGNKGYALKAFNKHIKRRFKNIIFVDDQKKNINDLANAYKGTKKSVTLIYYTRYSKAH